MYGESRRVFATRLRVTQWAVQRWEDDVTAVPASMGVLLDMLQLLAPREDGK